MLLDIRPDHLRMVLDILQKHVPQYEVWAFGSRAKWTAKDYSDLDLCVVSDKPLSFSILGALAEDFSESDLPWKVDVVDWATTSESFRKIIARDKVVVQKAAVPVMAGGWQSARIGDVAEVFDGPHATPKKTSSGPVFLGITTLDHGRLNLSDVEYLSEEDFAKWTRRVTPRAGDVVFSYETRLGEAALIPEGLRCCLGRRMGLVRAKENELDSRFFLYQYLSPAFQAFLRSRTVPGSTVDRIPLIEFPNFPIVLPPINEQRAIAHILGALDDKIELNRRMNETLESIARAMFKSWFVDFDPVRAKASVEAPESICQRLGFTPDLLALFPDRFKDSELGEIPEGWEVQPLAQLSEKISKGTTPTKQDIASATDEPSVPFIKVKDINDRGEVIRDGLELIPESVHIGALKRSVLEAGDILFSIAGTIGRIAVVEPDLANSNTNQAVAFVRLKDNAAHLGLCLQHLKSDRIQEAANASVVQAVQANVSLASLGAFKIVVPEAGVLELWNQTFGGIFNKTKICVAESRTLATIRDALLPKLLSGELRVPNIEKALDVVA